NGRIIDAVSDEPIPFANVYMKGLKAGGTSDMDGYYKIVTPYLSDSLYVSYIGYLNAAKKLSDSKEQTVNFKLERSDVTLQEIVILPGENPAHIIFRKIIENKEQNAKNSLLNYQFESYTKTE